MDLFARLRNAPQRAERLPYVVSGRVAYVVSHSYPFSSNGYAVRTHGVAQGLTKHGYSVVVFNRAGRPWDLAGFDEQEIGRQHVIDGVRYLFFRKPSTRDLDKETYLAAAADQLKEAFRVFKPSAVMAASDWVNALPAAIAARELGLPFFYEVRGFWELSRAAAHPGYEETEAFREYVDRETQTARVADSVFTLNTFMADELRRRGVSENKIEIVGNGYGELPQLPEDCRDAKGQIGITARYVLGYIGAFAAYEGLDDLVRACAGLRSQGLDVALLLVGSSVPYHDSGNHEVTCPFLNAYRDLAQELNVSPHVHMPGRVSPSQLGAYYAAIDLFVIPRRPVEVSVLVSPVKPLEAMAYGRHVLVSDVPPLAELARNHPTVHSFPAGNVDALQDAAAAVLEDDNRSDHWESAIESRRSLRDRHAWESVVQPMVVSLQSSMPGAIEFTWDRTHDATVRLQYV